MKYRPKFRQGDTGVLRSGGPTFTIVEEIHVDNEPTGMWKVCYYAKSDCISSTTDNTNWTLIYEVVPVDAIFSLEYNFEKSGLPKKKRVAG